MAPIPLSSLQPHEDSNTFANRILDMASLMRF